MYPKTLSDFYQFSLHLIYAVIIGQSFILASGIFVPLDNLNEFKGFENGFALFLSYVVAITGWVGWSRSIVKTPHSENALGNFRFITDLLILFLYYYLINLSSPLKIDGYSEAFVWVFPAIFFFYIIWDWLKYFEYKCDPVKAVSDRKKRARVTIYFFFVFLAQSLIYQYVTENYDVLNWDNNPIWTEIFISSSFALTIIYRWLKWKIPVARRRRGRKRNNKTNTTG